MNDLRVIKAPAVRQPAACFLPKGEMRKRDAATPGPSDGGTWGITVSF